MEKEFVTVKGEKYYVKERCIDLSHKEISDIAEIALLMLSGKMRGKNNN